MKAALYERFGGPVAVAELPEPEPGPEGAVLEVRATGICRSDWHGWLGHDPDIRLPHVPGHELAGVVVEVGRQVRNFAPGDRVTVPFVCGCGHCPQCASGNEQVCDRQSQPGFTHWGSYAERVRIDYADRNLVRLPDALDFVTAASLGCRFATSFRAVVAQGRVAAGQWVAVHGCGGVGLSAVMIAAALGARVLAIDVNDAALALARQAGAEACIDAARVDDVPAAIRDATGGGAAVSLDALGSAVTAFNSVACLAKRGRHVQVGLMAGDDSRAPLPLELVIARELEVVGSHGMQAHRYPDMLAMILDGRLDPARLVGRRVTLAEAAAGLGSEVYLRGPGISVIDRF
ncbi:MAG: zinc-dependent alcohol dehydrogenase family protein [Gammaproteobacteria bacterium]|nr:zinc-dependent alcohol dehydrogenase family protein [Gammaproteobacteria bacterium]MDH4254700.1 zinc-dependent alcohol dehydrogenase family protein [Gammaproteobacteria bacterium]MDH5308803.1 zinc-dependent alcohol dehydrogenase family protein [Gammaproteobacteria bacterium]